MFEVISDDSQPVYGPSYATTRGYIGTAGATQFGHRFGGASWDMADSDSADIRAALLLTLDLSDPLLVELTSTGLPELPLCSLLGYDLGATSQLFRIEADHRRVVCVQRKQAPDKLESDTVSVLDEKPLMLTPMRDEDLPTYEDRYWEASDSFVGGREFIRVLGPPLWLESVQVVKCSCGREMTYVASLGYEQQPPYSGLMGESPVFFGEMGLYWFVCPRCLVVAVTTQST